MRKAAFSSSRISCLASTRALLGHYPLLRLHSLPGTIRINPGGPHKPEELKIPSFRRRGSPFIRLSRFGASFFLPRPKHPNPSTERAVLVPAHKGRAQERPFSQAPQDRRDAVQMPSFLRCFLQAQPHLLEEKQVATKPKREPGG